jgi:predicted transglutaminase-like cysteine proteinase
MHAFVYALILFVVWSLRLAWEDIGSNVSRHEQVVWSWLDVRGCRCLNVAGLVAIGAGIALLWGVGNRPFQLWFLYAALMIGLLDVLDKDRLLPLPGDLPTPRVSEFAVAQVQESAGKTCSFTWLPRSEELRTLPCEQTFTIRTDEYQNARGRQRFPATPMQNLARYVREGHCDSLHQVSAFFRRRSTEHGLRSEQEMEDVVCFVRSVLYAPDLETRGVEDWVNFPVETLHDQAGDCEDHAILAAAILYDLGHDVALFWISLQDSAHLALGYGAPGLYGGPFSRKLEGQEYSYVETVPTEGVQRVGVLSLEFLKELKAARLIGL